MTYKPKYMPGVICQEAYFVSRVVKTLEYTAQWNTSFWCLPRSRLNVLDLGHSELANSLVALFRWIHE